MRWPGFGTRTWPTSPKPSPTNAPWQAGPAIQGKGAFRRFKDELHDEYPDLLPAWYAFRDIRPKRRSVQWLPTIHSSTAGLPTPAKSPTRPALDLSDRPGQIPARHQSISRRLQRRLAPLRARREPGRSRPIDRDQARRICTGSPSMPL
jgi:hypothetical protein